MAGPKKGKRPKKSFDSDTPLDRKHLREWAEHLAGQLENSDSVEVTLISKEGSGTRTVSFQAPANPNYNPCPARRPVKPKPLPEPLPEPPPAPPTEPEPEPDAGGS